MPNTFGIEKKEELRKTEFCIKLNMLVFDAEPVNKPALATTNKNNQTPNVAKCNGFFYMQPTNSTRLTKTLNQKNQTNQKRTSN